MRIGAGGFFPSEDEFVPSITPVLFPVTETWTVPDVLGSLNGDHPWRDDIGAHGWNVKGQAVELENTGTAAFGGRMLIDLGRDDYLTTIRVAEFFDSGSGIIVAGPMVRMPADTAFTGYAWTALSFNGVGSLNLRLFVNGAQTVLGSVPFTPVSGMTLGLRARGTTLIGYANGLPKLSLINGTIPFGRYVGLEGVANFGMRIRLDNLDVRPIRQPLTLELLTLTPMAGVH